MEPKQYRINKGVRKKYSTEMGIEGKERHEQGRKYTKKREERYWIIGVNEDRVTEPIKE